MNRAGPLGRAPRVRCVFICQRPFFWFNQRNTCSPLHWARIPMGPGGQMNHWQTGLAFRGTLAICRATDGRDHPKGRLSNRAWRASDQTRNLDEGFLCAHGDARHTVLDPPGRSDRTRLAHGGMSSDGGKRNLHVAGTGCPNSPQKWCVAFPQVPSSTLPGSRLPPRGRRPVAPHASRGSNCAAGLLKRPLACSARVWDH